jgi:hypothetical protein
MKKTIFILVVIFAAAALNPSSLFAQDESMQKWMEYMTPGDMHKMLAAHTGAWNAKTTFWMAPGGEPTNSEATANGEMIMGGRYLMSKFKGNMWGMPFEGLSIEGYDNATKMFNSSWVDNMGTGIMLMTGKYDETTKQIVYTGKTVDPISGNYVDVRQVVKYNSDGSMLMEMYGPGPDGKEFKTMEITFTKQ